MKGSSLTGASNETCNYQFTLAMIEVILHQRDCIPGMICSCRLKGFTEVYKGENSNTYNHARGLYFIYLRSYSDLGSEAQFSYGGQDGVSGRLRS